MNEMTKLSVTEKKLAIAGLDSRLDSLTIAHLSDLHFTGKLTRDYFDFVIDRVNELEADLIVLTETSSTRMNVLRGFPIRLAVFERDSRSFSFLAIMTNELPMSLGCERRSRVVALLILAADLSTSRLTAVRS